LLPDAACNEHVELTNEIQKVVALSLN
jgi:hypothetical protein